MGYRKPVEDVFIEVSRQITNKMTRLQLPSLKFLSSNSKLNSFPSWAIDWQDTEDIVSNPKTLASTNQGGNSRYLATGYTPTIIGVSGMRKLGLGGYTVAAISRVSIVVVLKSD